MSDQNKRLTGVARDFDFNEIIVSKTDLQGRLTYVNDVFLRLAGYTEKEVIGKPHNIIRHPEMPRCIFKLLWDTISSGKELFAYVMNRSVNGDHYWVLAHVTPSRNAAGEIVGYHSNRRVANIDTLNNTVIPLYKALLAEEKSHTNRKAGLEASEKMVLDLLEREGKEANEYFLSI